MCPPRHFDVLYEINPWMTAEIPVDRERAQTQWHELRRTLERAGAHVEEIEPQEGWPDMVFAANAGIVAGHTFVPAVMRNVERVGERTFFDHWMTEHGFNVDALPGGLPQEGAGDALPFAGRLVAGHQTRSSAEAYGELAEATGADVLAVELQNPWYHVDLAFCPLDDEHAIVYPPAFGEEGWARLAEHIPHPIVLDPAEAELFCANSVVVGRTVVMPACPPRLRAELEALGFEPVVVDVSEFLKAGGGPRCLTLALDVPREALGVGPVARNYSPLPVTIASGEGAWVTDTDGNRYLDGLAGYSALNFGHRHPVLVAAAQNQLDRLTLTSRAFGNAELEPFARELAELCGKDLVLPMNTGAEAVETAIKTARKWGYDRKGVAPGRAKIVVCDGNFHGRTTTIVSFSDDHGAREGFGPFTPGFESVPFGDAQALARALEDPDVVAFLLEPIQGEAGVIIPPEGYLAGVRRLCSERGVLMIADEIQSGLARTGRTFACDHEGVVPDIYVLGKALGGGILPLSAVAADENVLGVFHPGEHGSTFGGNPLACAVGRSVLGLLSTGEFQHRSSYYGERLARSLEGARLPGVAAIRARGLWLGIDLDGRGPTGRELSERLLRLGLLAKDTHGHTIRIAPPLVIGDAEVDFIVNRFVQALGARYSAQLAA